MCSVVRWSAVGIFSISGFHRFLATKPVSSETSKERRSVATIVLSGTRGPWLFRVIREGLGSAVRLSARSTQQPNYTSETLSRPRVSREPDGHRLRTSLRWSGLGPRHSSCLWFQILGVEARPFLPDDQRNRGNLACQRKTGHLWPHAFGQQSRVA